MSDCVPNLIALPVGAYYAGYPAPLCYEAAFRLTPRADFAEHSSSVPRAHEDHVSWGYTVFITHAELAERIGTVYQLLFGHLLFIEADPKCNRSDRN